MTIVEVFLFTNETVRIYVAYKTTLEQEGIRDKAKQALGQK